jgi:LmbE family N-acetylglucosaminyl deacetylase
MIEEVVVFAPHPDDEVLGCGGTIAKKSKEGARVSIVFLTDGRNFLKDFGILEPSPLELKSIRKEEAIRATDVLGVPQEDLVFLDIEDGTLKQNERVASEKIGRVLNESTKSVYFPQKKEFHTDHREANYLLKAVIRHKNFHPLEYQYPIAWVYPLNLLPRLRPQHMQSVIMSQLLEQNFIHEDISEFLSAKKAALKEYRSQLTIISREQKRPALKDSFVKSFLKNYELFFTNR